MSLPRDVLIGGNHLANYLIGKNCMPDEWKSYGDVLRAFGGDVADVWACWRAIMNHRGAAE